MSEEKSALPEGAKLLDDKKHFHLKEEKYGKAKTEKPKKTN